MGAKLFFIFVTLNLFLLNPILAQTPTPSSTVQSKISLEFKGIDVVDVLKILATRFGMNIAVGKNVTGKVTLFLKDVDLWDAVEIILLSNDLAYEKKGDIINVMTQKDYELLYGENYQDKKQVKIIHLKYAKAADLSKALNQIKSNLGRIVTDDGSNTVALIDSPQNIKNMEDFIKKADLPLQTKIFDLNYASADKLSAKLQEVITKGVGSIKIDERMNKIAITDFPNKLIDISKIISAFDEKTPQVLIDAQIIKVTPSDQLTMGVDWEYFLKKHFDIKSSLAVGTTGSLFIGTPNVTPSQIGQYKAILDILRTIGDTKILSSPRIMSLNNTEAKIHVGVKDAYITSTTSQSGTGTTVTSQSVNFVDTGIQLSVTPTINRDGFVTMKIKPEISDSTRTDIKSEGQITQIPIVSTSEAETTVIVKNGVTILIGGLSKDKKDKTVKKIPVLGDMPLLGFLFRSTSDTVTKDELVILLTPHIISGQNSFTEFSEVRPIEGAVLRMDEGKIIKEKINPIATGSPFDYYQIITKKIDQFTKLNSPSGKKGEVKVNFILSSDGNVIAEPTIINTTDSSLIPFAIKAIKDASPFPAFPKELNKMHETFKISLRYE